MSYYRRLESSVNKLREDVRSLEKLVIEKFDSIKELLLSKPSGGLVTEAVDDTNVTPTVIGPRRPSVRFSATSSVNSVSEAADVTNVVPAVIGPRRRSVRFAASSSVNAVSEAADVNNITPALIGPRRRSAHLLTTPSANLVSAAADVNNITPAVIGTRRRSVHLLATPSANSVSAAADVNNITPAVIGPRRRSAHLLTTPSTNSVSAAADVNNITPAVIGPRRRSVHLLAPPSANSVLEAADVNNVTPAVIGPRRRSLYLLATPRAKLVSQAVDVNSVTPEVISPRRRSAGLLATPSANTVSEAVDHTDDTDDTSFTPAVIGPRRRSVRRKVLGASARKRANSTLKVKKGTQTAPSIAASTSNTSLSPGPQATVDGKHELTTVLKELMRKKEKAQRGGNTRALAEAHNDIARFYHKHNRYIEALDEYTLEATIWKNLGLRMKWGTCNSKIGEIYMMMAEFKKALECENRHLAVAKEQNNLVEEQRGMGSRGRIYLLQGQSTGNTAEAKESFNMAYQAFIESLRLCEKLSGKINEHELMDMKVRVYLNIGVVQENLGFFDKGLGYIQEAISICEEHQLYDILHKCYISATLLYCDRKKLYDKALECINKALEVAGRRKDKNIKTCEALSIKAEIFCKMPDYLSAKQVLFKAWKLKTPDENKRKDIECNLKAVAAICQAKQQLVLTDLSDHNTIKKLYEKMADGACSLENYPDAIDNYLNQLKHAKLAGDSGKTLIPIYVSLYRTYKDMGAYSEALEYYEKEYELVKDVPKEAFTTLYSYAEALFLAKRPYDQIEKACFRAMNAARDWKKRKYEMSALKALLKYQEEYKETEKMVNTKLALGVMGYEDSVNLENSEDEGSAGVDEDTTHIGDDICLDDLTDPEEEDATVTQKKISKKGRGCIIKKNRKGETQLHLACISGNKQLVNQLISKGHPVNTRDNAGWLPLHEACMNGHIEIVNILIKSGADINDKGGKHCDGTTPLHDAASNGHLEVVQLLLDSGAKPSLKTDIGETPLHVLEKWRIGTNLNKNAEILYNNICNQMHAYNDETNSAENLNVVRSKSPVKIVPSTSNVTSRVTGLKGTSLFSRRVTYEDDSDDDSDSSQNIKNSLPCDDLNSNENDKSDNDDYRNTKFAAGNRRTNGVDDDCLDYDLGLNNSNKKRKHSDSINVVAKKPTYEDRKDSIECINRRKTLADENNANQQNKSKLMPNNIVFINENSLDYDEIKQCSGSLNVDVKKELNNRNERVDQDVYNENSIDFDDLPTIIL